MPVTRQRAAERYAELKLARIRGISLLEHLGLVGVSWRQDGSEALAEFALQQERAAAQLQEFAQRMQLDELAYLATCNRVELHALRKLLQLRGRAFLLQRELRERFASVLAP